MRRLKWILLLMFGTAFATLPGCSIFPAKPVYVPPGHAVELAQDVRVDAWIINKDTQKRERRKVDTKGLSGPWLLFRDGE